METLGLDLGFRQVKASKSNEDFKFDSVIGYPSFIELQNDAEPKDPLNNLVIQLDGMTYYVGSKAIRDTKNGQLTFSAEKTNDKSENVKVISALGYAMGDEKEATFRMVTGLPIDELGITGLKENMQKNLEKKHVFTFNEQEKEATVNRVDIIAQSAGAYYDYILDANGTIIEDKVKPRMIVIDIGYRTTDVVCMDNAKYNTTYSFTTYTGIHDIHQEFRKALLTKHRIHKHITEIDSTVRGGLILLNDNVVDLKDLILECSAPFVEKIISELPLYIPNMKEVNLFLLTGGGAAILSDYFIAALEGPTEVIPNSETSNARGYHKYLKLLQQNGK